MSKSIYLINPKADFPNYYSAEVVAHLGLTPTAFIADLVITTVAALVPNDFEVTLCDEQITPVDFETSADVVGITGKSSQVGRMIELAQAFRQRGKVVRSVICINKANLGTPFDSTTPSDIPTASDANHDACPGDRLI